MTMVNKLRKMIRSKKQSKRGGETMKRKTRRSSRRSRRGGGDMMGMSRR
jgi:hypothetical protein